MLEIAKNGEIEQKMVASSPTQQKTSLQEVSTPQALSPSQGMELVFCYQNCSDLQWEKIVPVIEKNIWNLRLKAENLQKFWDH